MDTTSSLPRFRSPPVDEVVIGLQFEAQGFLPIHYGAFYEYIKSEFPGVQTLPAVRPFGPATGVPPFGPRVAYVSEDDCSLIQLQSDRLYFNWRRRPHNPSYPSYEKVKVKFSDAYENFCRFAGANQIAFQPTMAEMVYVNQFTTANTGVDGLSSMSSIFRVWSPEVGPEWAQPPQELAFNAQYRLSNDDNEQCGVLVTTMTTGRDGSGSPVARLELGANSTIGQTTFEAVQAFHDIGHAAIVRCFTAITTKSMHDKWDRYQ